MMIGQGLSQTRGDTNTGGQNAADHLKSVDMHRIESKESANWGNAPDEK